ncbi:uncharacterized protein NEMAJ01_1923 [Nematocida major]|uniref:uncharacterized protein n=1 Tax=Nematocida major TaxID=1912982 RepID=UPI002007F018|nr:uncharacterized protein NEMAJ01_1923 [Nematocida major]KAH9387027.1 hypothetical protein NEMAJ01_1923 [Nematocida major]
MHFCITGGSRGLGEALAAHILLNNHAVTVVDKVKPSMHCAFIQHDFKERFKRRIYCDVLILNHATFHGFKSFQSISPLQAQEYMQINVHSHLDLLKTCTYKKVVYINSVLSIAAFPNTSMYCACKSFMHALLESFRREGCSVLAVYPYKIDTPLFQRVRSPYTLKRGYVAKRVYEAVLRGDTHLYLPWVFRYSYVYALLPTFLQDWVARILYYWMVRK